ncbi:hypothetical protein [Thermocrinis minervae]|uniref:Uncharacterized protein n=1 Tax=Thermocrinis minervae TaxID=381751 RepID=A0A1M6RUL8_9AQUI|nr:hypothetical protein [Thermocrinis minervae]SHK36156.1 hypothetical protein SAMN05444391_0772 [Thermocrinis minervae]
MELQIVLKSKEDLQTALEPFRNWEELSYSLEEIPYGDCFLYVARVEDKDFEKLVGIFQSKEEAMGAFLTLCMEYGWEEVPKSYVIYHAVFDGDRLVAAIKTEQGIEEYVQTTLEDMIKKIASYPRVVAFSYDVVTYIKDIYPDIDSKLYLVSKELNKLGLEVPSVEGLSNRQAIELIESLLEKLPPVSKPLTECEQA